MTGFIRNPQTLQAEQQVEVISYELPWDSLSTSSGKVEIAGELEGDFSHSIFSLDEIQGKIWVIESNVTSDTKITTLSVAPYLKAVGDVSGYAVNDSSLTALNKSRSMMYMLVSSALGYLPQSNTTVDITQDGYISSKTSYLPNYRTIRSVYGKRPIDKLQYIVVTVTPQVWELFNDNTLPNDIADLSLGVCEGDSVTLYSVDTAKFLDYLISTGTDVIVDCEDEGLFRYESPSVGNGIYYNGAKYRITSIKQSQYFVEEDSSVDCELYSTRVYSTSGGTNFSGSYLWYYNRKKTVPLNVGGSALLIDLVEKDLSQTKVVYFEDGHSELSSYSFDDDVCSRVEVAVCYASGSNYRVNRLDYYLTSDGTISATMSDQILGSTTYLFVDAGGSTIVNWDDYKYLAEEEFAKNTYNHKVEFCSDMELSIGQPVKLMMKREILDTTISKVVKKSNDNRFYYTCGELSASATDKIQANNWHYGFRKPTTAKSGYLHIS